MGGREPGPERPAQLAVALMMDDPQFSRILFYESLGIDEEINDTIHRGFDLFGALTAAYLRNGVDKGFLRKDLVIEETAFALNAVLLEGARRISLSEEPEKAFEKWTKALVDLMLDGMADRGTTSQEPSRHSPPAART